MLEPTRPFPIIYCLKLEHLIWLKPGGGVAGLSAIATAKNMGAIVRGFDTREAVKEQVQSLGAEFLEITGIEESGEGELIWFKQTSRDQLNNKLVFLVSIFEDITNVEFANSYINMSEIPKYTLHITVIPGVWFLIWDPSLIWNIA